MSLGTVKHIIFDFGAVIINIDILLAYKAFSQLSGRSLAEVEKLFEQDKAYWKYEVGELDDEGFRNLLRTTLKLNISDQELDNAWNLLLLDVPEERVNLIRRLSENYPVYLLSNTNPIHIRECREIFRRQHGIDNFRDLFQKTYMSYEIGKMKPDPEFYNYVLDDIGCRPEEVLFLDDNKKNIEGAAALGIQTRLITKEQGINYWLEHVEKL